MNAPNRRYVDVPNREEPASYWGSLRCKAGPLRTPVEKQLSTVWCLSFFHRSFTQIVQLLHIYPQAEWEFRDAFGVQSFRLEETVIPADNSVHLWQPPPVGLLHGLDRSGLAKPLPMPLPEVLNEISMLEHPGMQDLLERYRKNPKSILFFESSILPTSEPLFLELPHLSPRTAFYSPDKLRLTYTTTTPPTGLRRSFEAEDESLDIQSWPAIQNPSEELAGEVLHIEGEVLAGPELLEAMVSRRKCAFVITEMRNAIGMELVHEAKKADFFYLRTATGKRVKIETKHAQLQATFDHKKRSGWFEKLFADPDFEPWLQSLGLSASGWGGTLRCHEAVLEVGERVRVLGRLHTEELTPEERLQETASFEDDGDYRESVRLYRAVMKGSLHEPLLITDRS